MNLNIFVKGCCEDFCPQNESEMRTREKLLHFYELNPPREYHTTAEQITIKSFSRSAAGRESAQESDLRTFDALYRTVEYLLKYILMDKRKPLHFKYDFIFNRLRSVRQEIVIQNFGEVETIELIEPIVMFLSFSSYELCQSPIDIFDPKICSQHLQECLIKLLRCYDDIDQRCGEQHTNYLPNREFCECLYIIFNLGNKDALHRAIRLRKTFINGNLFNMCLTMSLQYFLGNFYNAIRLIKLLPRILCGLALLSLQKLRREILLRFSTAYNSKTIQSSWLAKLLLYDDIQLLVSDCKYYKLEVSSDSKEIKFSKLNFDVNKVVIKPRHEQFADTMLSQMPLPDILLFNEKLEK